MGPETRISDAMNKTQMSWLIGIIGGLIAVGTGAKTFWNDWGWITPAQASEANACWFWKKIANWASRS